MNFYTLLFHVFLEMHLFPKARKAPKQHYTRFLKTVKVHIKQTQKSNRAEKRVYFKTCLVESLISLQKQKIIFIKSFYSIWKSCVWAWEYIYTWYFFLLAYAVMHKKMSSLFLTRPQSTYLTVQLACLKQRACQWVLWVWRWGEDADRQLARQEQSDDTARPEPHWLQWDAR